MSDEFVDTESSMPFLNGNFDFDRDYVGGIERLKREGYVVCPDWMPVGLPGYEWEFVAMLEAMMRPGPRVLDRIKYQLLRRTA